MGRFDRLQHTWNAFKSYDSKEQQPFVQYDYSFSSSSRPDRFVPRFGTRKTLINALYTRIAIDAASLSVQHVRLDENGRFLAPINSSLNRCLTVEANLDQTGRAFIQDAVASLCDEGCIAIVPTITDIDPDSGAYHIEELRVGRIVEWYPHHVKAEVYNEDTGRKQVIVMNKRACAIVENPLYAVMNQPNSTLQRLISKLNILDALDSESAYGKLDMIIQLPYVIKTEQRRTQAEQRRKDIEMQLSGSKYGIAYTDGTEKVIQLNRSTGNNLMEQITYLTEELFSQTGISKEVFMGTADDVTMLNYQSRTVEPMLSAITTEMDRTFISKTARSQGQAIRFFTNPFKMTPVSQVAEIADKMTRNEIMSPNEIRSILGYRPDPNPKSDELRNRNINQSDAEISSEKETEDKNQNDSEK